MNCCSVNGLDRFFNRTRANRELRAYLKKGPPKRQRVLVDYLKTHNLAGASLLEIGCGIGALHFELLKAGAAKAVGLELAPAYIEAAREVSERLGLQDAVEYELLDLAEQGQAVADADIVLLDRVICCYPDMHRLVTAAAQHARSLVVLTYPPPVWWMQIGKFFLNTAMVIIKRRFRFFLHDPQKVKHVLSGLAFDRIYNVRSGICEIGVFQRGSTATRNRH